MWTIKGDVVDNKRSYGGILETIRGDVVDHKRICGGP